jgi:tryptophan synthase alpha subunit
MDAADLTEDDPQITEALLARATGDRVASIRSAAIDALAPRMSSPAVSEQLISLLEGAESPLAQFALVDLVLRYGDSAQLGALRDIANSGRLHPDLERYIDQSLGRESNET